MPKREGQPLLVDEVRAFKGIDNRRRWEELGLDDLYSATNVDITMNGSIQSAMAPELVLSGDYCWGEGTSYGILIIHNGHLILLNDRLEYVDTIQYDVGRDRMRYAHLGHTTIYTNYRVIGGISKGVAYTMSAPDRVFYGRTPAGQCLDFHLGRLCVARDSDLYSTDVARYNQVDMRYGVRKFDSRITMVRSVKSTLFVGTRTTTYSVTGQDWMKAQLHTADLEGVIEGTDLLVPGRFVLDGSFEKVGMWTSESGVCVGAPDGKVVNLTKERYQLSAALKGASIYRQVDNVSQFITTLVS